MATTQVIRGICNCHAPKVSHILCAAYRRLIADGTYSESPRTSITQKLNSRSSSILDLNTYITHCILSRLWLPHSKRPRPYIHSPHPNHPVFHFPQYSHQASPSSSIPLHTDTLSKAQAQQPTQQKPVERTSIRHPIACTTCLKTVASSLQEPIGRVCSLLSQMPNEQDRRRGYMSP